MSRLLPIVVLVFTGCAGSPPEKPPMNSVLQKIVHHKDAKPASPATEEAIAKVASRFKNKLPDRLIELWRLSDGVEFDDFESNLMGPTQVLELLDNRNWFDFQNLGYLPFFDNHQSDFFAICMTEPLSYRIIYQPHDDGLSLAYRDLDSFLEDLSLGLAEGKSADLYFHDRPGNFTPWSPRTTEDQVAARAILSKPNVNQSWNQAIQLLDDSDPEIWKKLLETNHFIRRDARGHLSALAKTSPQMKALYEQDQREFAAFFDQFEKAAKEAKLPVGKRSDDCLDVGGHWIDLDGLFHQRNEPRAMERMMNLCRDFIADRDPRVRPDYINKKITE